MDAAAVRASRLERELASKRYENRIASRLSFAALFLVLIAYVMAVARRYMPDTDTAWYHVLGEYCSAAAGVLLLVQLVILRFRRKRAPTTPTPANASLAVQQRAVQERIDTLQVDLEHEFRCNGRAITCCFVAFLLVFSGLALSERSGLGLLGMLASCCAAFVLIGQGCCSGCCSDCQITAGPPADLPPVVAAGPPLQRQPIVWPTDLTFPSEGVPPSFECPITQRPMANPAVTPRGTSYDRAALVEWISRRHRYPSREVRAAHSNHTHAPRTACAPLTPRY